MLNVVILSGRLTATPELKTTSNGNSVTSFTIAVDRRVKAGEEKSADFINCVAWRQTAEFVCKYFDKGNPIAIEGALSTRKYQDKDGNNRVATEVNVGQVHFIGRKNEQSDSAAVPSTSEPNFTEVATSEELPF